MTYLFYSRHETFHEFCCVRILVPPHFLIKDTYVNILGKHKGDIKNLYQTEKMLDATHYTIVNIMYFCHV